MRYGAFVEEVDHLGTRLADTAEQDLEVAVPTCPGWSASDLVRHVAQVDEHKIASTELQRVHEPTDPSPTWWPDDQTVGFWARRMAHETAIHGADAELAFGPATPLDAALAVDGIDEILKIMLAGDWSEAPSPGSIGQRVAVVGGDRTWIITLGRTSIQVAEGFLDGVSATVGGEPSNVDLWLWGRAPEEALEVSGEQSDVRLLRERLVLATQ